MPANVLWGVGEPRFGIPTAVIHNNTVSSATATTVVLTSAVDLTSLDTAHGLVNFLVWSYNSSDISVHGKITAFADSTDTLTVDGWSAGNPANGKALFIQGKRIDLPYCQRLTESFTPDFIVKKMINGSLRRIKRGFYYSATLDYARYFHKKDMELLRDLFNRDTLVIYFNPRRDNSALWYDVDISSETEIAFYQLQNHQGHGGIVINIIGVIRLGKIPFIDPTQTIAGVITDDGGVHVTDDTGIYITED